MNPHTNLTMACHYAENRDWYCKIWHDIMKRPTNTSKYFIILHLTPPRSYWLSGSPCPTTDTKGGKAILIILTFFQNSTWISSWFKRMKKNTKQIVEVDVVLRIILKLSVIYLQRTYPLFHFGHWCDQHKWCTFLAEQNIASKVIWMSTYNSFGTLYCQVDIKNFNQYKTSIPIR